MNDFINYESWSLYPVLGITTNPYKSIINMSIFYRYPIAQNTNQKEQILGLEIRIPISSNNPYPLYANQKAIILNLEYRKLELNLVNNNFDLDIEHESSTISLGYNF